MLNRITQIDEQVGLIQKIVCDLEDSAHQNSCHFLEGTICHILEHCGDDKLRFVGCRYDFDWKVLLPTLSSFVWTNRWIFFPVAFTLFITITLAIIPEIL